MSQKDPIMEVQPCFLYWPAFISRIPLTIFMTIWGAGFFGIFSFLGLSALGEMGFKPAEMIPGWLPAVFFGGLFLGGAQFWSLIMEQKMYKNTRYLFFPDEIVYYEGYWGIEEKSINYKNILEVTYTKGIMQQKYGLGTVKLITAAHGYSSSSNQGIQIKDVPDSENVYRFIKEQVEKSQAKEKV